MLHDIVWHHLKESEFTQLKSISSPSLLLISTLHGDKVLIKNNEDIENMGAIFLYENQKKYYLDYFLLLLTFWNIFLLKSK